MGYSADSLLGLRLKVRAAEMCVCFTLATPNFCALNSALRNPVTSGREMCLNVVRILSGEISR